MTSKLLFTLLLVISFDSFAMVAETTRVSLWRRGESIAGEEFIAATEEIVDYLATLPRPTELLKAKRYDCQVKSRLIRPSVTGTTSTSTSSGWVEVRMVYELRDCVPVQ